jgi:hypothetical protein
MMVIMFGGSGLRPWLKSMISYVMLLYLVTAAVIASDRAQAKTTRKSSQ